MSGYPLNYDGRWSIDLEVLERACRDTGPPPRAIVVVNPNNPTGSPVRASERAGLEAIAACAGAALVSDEVFFEYLGSRGEQEAPGDRAVSLAEPVTASPQPAPPGGGALKFVLGGLSKSCGLPQMKLAWVAVDGPDDPVAEAMERLDLVADTYLSVGSPVQRAAGRLLAIGDRMRASIQRRVDTNFETLRQTARAVVSLAPRLLQRSKFSVEDRSGR